MQTLFKCPYCGKTKPSENGTGSDVACCGEAGHVKEVPTQRSWEGYLHDPDAAEKQLVAAPKSDCTLCNGVGFVAVIEGGTHGPAKPPLTRLKCNCDGTINVGAERVCLL